MEDGRATVIDAGVVTSIDGAFASPFASFLLALCTGDVDELSDRLLQFNQSSSFDAPAFRRDIAVRGPALPARKPGGRDSVQNPD